MTKNCFNETTLVSNLGSIFYTEKELEELERGSLRKARRDESLVEKTRNIKKS